MGASCSVAVSSSESEEGAALPASKGDAAMAEAQQGCREGEARLGPKPHWAGRAGPEGTNSWTGRAGPKAAQPQLGYNLW